MPRRYIHHFKFHALDQGDEKTGFKAAMDNLPGRAARRMSRLGILMHHLLKDMHLDLETNLVYGTKFSESSALEKFLDSFPYPSPTAFQTSIHPGGVEQALILDKREVGAFFPMAGGRYLMMQMLISAFSTGAGDVVLCGGEEKGNWLADFGLAHHCSFAFAMRITDDPENACGELLWEPESGSRDEAVPDMNEILVRFSSGENVSLDSPDLGLIRISPL